MSNILLFPDLHPVDFAEQALWNVARMSAASPLRMQMFDYPILPLPSLTLEDNIELVMSAIDQIGSCAFELSNIIDAHAKSEFEFRCNRSGIRFLVKAVACGTKIWVTDIEEMDDEFDRMQLRFEFFR